MNTLDFSYCSKNREQKVSKTFLLGSVRSRNFKKRALQQLIRTFANKYTTKLPSILKILLICITNLNFFSDFTKWESDVADIGCSISNGCSESDGIVAIPYYSEDTDTMDMVWNAQDKDYKMPYVCMSKCPKYYLWFPGMYKNADYTTFT